MMKKIFLFLIVAGAIGVIGTGVLDNYISLETQEINKFEGVVELDDFDCTCEDSQNPGATCDIVNTADMSCGP